MDSKLNDVDLHSATWLKLRDHIEARIQLLRVKNDRRLSLEDTAIVRGQITELKFLLGLEKSEPTQVADHGGAE